MNWNIRTLIIVCFLASRLPLVGQTQEEPEILQVAIKESAPFTIKNDNGTWGGLAVELWREVATSLNLNYEWVERDLDGVLSAVANGQAHVGMAALTMTAEREAIMDFSHPFHQAGLAVAVAGGSNAWLLVFRNLFSLPFLSAVAALLVVLVGTGVALWLFERKANAEEFGGTIPEGIGKGLWWSAVTMTTVGYGDKAPKTTGGRILALIWMFAAIIVISGFTAGIASSLTVGTLESSVNSIDDLSGSPVGTISGSTSERYLKRRQFNARGFDTIDAALVALDRGEIRGVLYDEPILRYRIDERGWSDKLRILNQNIEAQYYAFALKEGLPDQEAINRTILAVLSTQTWRLKHQAYMGGSPDPGNP